MCLHVLRQGRHGCHRRTDESGRHGVSVHPLQDRWRTRTRLTGQYPSDRGDAALPMSAVAPP